MNLHQNCLKPTLKPRHSASPLDPAWRLEEAREGTTLSPCNVENQSSSSSNTKPFNSMELAVCLIVQCLPGRTLYERHGAL